MIKIFLILPILGLLSSCTFIAPTNEEVYEQIKIEKGYDNIYIFSYATAYENILAPEEERNNPYGLVYTFYGNIDGADVMYVYGIQEWGIMFEPYIYERPLVHSYDECITLFEARMEGKTFLKNRSDNVSILSNTDSISSIFESLDIEIDNNFVLRCDGNNYVYEVNGELRYSFLN